MQLMPLLPHVWTFGDLKLDLSQPHVMGILNVSQTLLVMVVGIIKKKMQLPAHWK